MYIEVFSLAERYFVLGILIASHVSLAVFATLLCFVLSERMSRVLSSAYSMSEIFSCAEEVKPSSSFNASF